MSDIHVAVLLARLENVLESARLAALDQRLAALDHIKDAKKIVEQIKGLA